MIFQLAYLFSIFSTTPSQIAFDLKGEPKGSLEYFKGRDTIIENVHQLFLMCNLSLLQLIQIFEGWLLSLKWPQNTLESDTNYRIDHDLHR